MDAQVPQFPRVLTGSDSRSRLSRGRNGTAATSEESRHESDGSLHTELVYAVRYEPTEKTRRRVKRAEVLREARKRGE